MAGPLFGPGEVSWTSEPAENGYCSVGLDLRRASREFATRKPSFLGHFEGLGALAQPLCESPPERSPVEGHSCTPSGLARAFADFVEHWVVR
jgi:hypothetical protein